LHQHPYLFDGSVFDNVAYGLRCRRVPSAEIQRIVSEALAWAGLSHLTQRHAQCLSGGERQRVALTRARVLSPRLLLLDEPTASMDKEAREQTYFLLRRLQHENLSIILTSHELHEDSRLSNHVLTLEHGRLSTDTALSHFNQLPPLQAVLSGKQM
jgi:tungstate transport system ATP-binding protein